MTRLYILNELKIINKDIQKLNKIVQELEQQERTLNNKSNQATFICVIFIMCLFFTLFYLIGL